MPVTAPSDVDRPAGTLGAALERRRLEDRAARIERVLDALHHRAVYRAHAGGVPEPLRHAIAGFSKELDAVRARLHASGRPAPVRSFRSRPRREP